MLCIKGKPQACRLRGVVLLIHDSLLCVALLNNAPRAADVWRGVGSCACKGLTHLQDVRFLGDLC